MADKNEGTMVKGGYFYRKEKGGSKMLRIRKAGQKPDKPTPEPLGARAKKDPKLLQRALRDPGLRSKLPDSMLTPAQREARQTNAFTRQLGDVSTPLTGPSMVSAAQRLTDLEYKPQYQNLDAEEKKATASGKQQAAWAQGYDRDAQAIMDANKNAQAAANATTQASLRQLAQQAGVGATAQYAGGQQAAAMDAGVRGQGLGGGTAAVDSASQSILAANAGNAQTQQAAAGAQGEAQAALLRSLSTAGAMRGQETQGAIRNSMNAKLADIAGQRRTLKQSEGAAFTKGLLGLRQSEGDRLITQQTLASKDQQAILEAKTAAASLKSKEQLAAANRALQVRLRQMGIDAETARQMSDQAFRGQQNALDRQQSDTNNRRTNGGKGGKPKFTTAQLNAAADKRDSALQLAGVLKGKGKKRGDVLTALTQKYGPLYARVAVGSIYDGGAVGHLNTELFNRYGIRIPKRYLATGKRANG